MGWKPKVKVTKPKVSVSLIKCGRCGKSYSNPLTHVCVIRSGYKKKRR